jgi:hypothetical protein
MTANSTPRIATLRHSYGRFMGLLPEELTDNTAQELNQARAQLNEIVTEDGITLDSLLAQNHFRFSVNQFENPQLTIR